MAYITLNEVKGYLFPRGDAPAADSGLGSLDAWIMEHLPEVDAVIDEHVGHSFPTAATATKYYVGTGTDTLWIDPVVTIASVHYLTNRATDTWSEITSAEYYTWPYNDPPTQCLTLDPSTSNISRWPVGLRNVRVVGSFGYSTVPTAIQRAAKEILRRMLMRSEQFRTLFYQDSLATPAMPEGALPVLWDDELTALVKDYTAKRMPYG